MLRIDGEPRRGQGNREVAEQPVGPQTQLLMYESFLIRSGALTPEEILYLSAKVTKRLKLPSMSTAEAAAQLSASEADYETPIDNGDADEVKVG